MLDDPRRAAALFLAMIEGDLHRATIMWVRSPSTRDIEEAVEAAVTLFLGGAAPAPG